MKLPTIAQDRPAAFRAYAQLLYDHEHNGGLIRGRDTHIELVAIGAAESGLNNMAIGRNDVNGTPEGATTGPPTNVPLHYSLGLGWLQHDSGWLLADTQINGVAWSIEQIRNDPEVSIELLHERPGFIIYQGISHTYIDFDKWAVWPRKSDAFKAEAAAAYDAVTAP